MAIADIVQIAEKVLEAIGQQSPEGFSDLYAEELSRQLGGGAVYIRAGMTKEAREIRDKLIRKEFNGQNIDQICRKYRIKRRRVYQIVNQN